MFRPRATENGQLYPCNRATYLRLVGIRVERSVDLVRLNAPAIMLKASVIGICRALLGSIFPCSENRLRRNEEQVFLDGLCAKLDGWAWCKLEKGHKGICVFDWEEAADAMFDG